MKKIIIAILIFCIGSFIYSCSKDDDSKSSSGFDRTELTKGLANQIIDENLNLLISETEGFNTCVETLKTSGNEADFIALKSCWKALAEQWQLSRFFMIKDLKYTTQEQVLAYWPINQPKVEENISTSLNIDQTWVQTLGSNQKGIFALEYLIFTKSWADLSSSPQILNYISAIALENIKAAKHLESTWINSYKTKFIESTDNFVTSTVPIVTNRLIEYSEYSKNEKLGYPLGLVKYTAIDQQKLESIYATYSVELLMKNLEIVKLVYLGGNQTNAIGYDDYILSFGQQGQDLDTKIKAKMDQLENMMLSIPKPAYSSLSTANTEYVQLYEEWKALIKMFKTEFITLVEVTPTFSDGDGD